MGGTPMGRNQDRLNTQSVYSQVGERTSRRQPAPRNMTQPELSASTIRVLASGLGFDLCRIAAPLSGAVHADYLEAWLEEGCHGDMAWLARNPDIRMHPDRLLVADSQPVRTLVVLGVDYLHTDLPEHVRRDPSRGIFARYAWHEDYHDQIKPRLFELDARIRKLSGRTCPCPMLGGHRASSGT